MRRPRVLFAVRASGATAGRELLGERARALSRARARDSEHCRLTCRQHARAVRLCIIVVVYTAADAVAAREARERGHGCWTQECPVLAQLDTCAHLLQKKADKRCDARLPRRRRTPLIMQWLGERCMAFG